MGAVSGDPFGLIALPIIWGVQTFAEQRKRLEDNWEPESVLGKRFGYVRDKGKWYPSILTQRTRDEGWIGSNKTQITMQFGTELRWRKVKGSNNFEPYFEDGRFKQKNFHVRDAEVDDADRDGSKKYRDVYDPLRDFYFMNDEDTKKMLHGMGGGTRSRTRTKPTSSQTTRRLRLRQTGMLRTTCSVYTTITNMQHGTSTHTSGMREQEATSRPRTSSKCNSTSLSRAPTTIV